MASNFTEHFQLSQWEPGDQVLREDFNKDNRKIDRAIAEVIEGIPYVKILEVTTTADAKEVEADVSGVDFTAYYRVDLFCSCADMNHLVELRVNGQTEGYYYGSAGGTGAGNSDRKFFAYLGGNFFFRTPHTGAQVGCMYFHGVTGFSGTQSAARCKWEELSSMRFNATNDNIIPAGTKIVLYGLKK